MSLDHSAELRTAAQALLDLAAETADELAVNDYWHSQHAAPSQWFANGVTNAIGGAPGELAALLSPAVARSLASWLRHEADHTGRGTRDALTIARTINRGRPCEQTRPRESPARPSPEPERQFPDEAACEKANLSAVFHPGDGEGLPCIEVCGVLVFVYLDVHSGTLRVSVDRESANAALTQAGGTVPLRIETEDRVVWDDI
ncbi:hypothetical protein [Streptomyces smyrnaeus]|uniref:hypothetical protein n=1 Tax=Streptomyces smyrnaeus TaxID=1387713 RepID=UPI000C19C1BF